MVKKKNYLNNDELKDEILKCINEAYDRAVANGFVVDDFDSDSDSDEKKTLFENASELGYDPDRSAWIRQIKEFDPDVIEEMVMNKEMTREEANIYIKQMEKPVVSDNLGKMFQLIVENVARSFYWSNPDDGEDCKANALLDLCSNFWKFEPVDSNGKALNAFAFCTQIAYFGIAGAHRILHPKKYSGTISISCLDENGKSFDLYNI